MPEAAELASAFPPPPAHFRKFTSDKWKAAKAFLGDAELDSPTVRIEDLPDEVRELLPPPLPRGDGLVLFGNFYPNNLSIPSLASQNLTTLYNASTSKKSSLVTLLKSVLKTFLHLLHSLTTQRTLPLDKIDRLRMEFVNIHHLINEYRADLALDAVKTAIKIEIERRNRLISELKIAMVDSELVLKRLGDGSADAMSEDVEMADAHPTRLEDATMIERGVNSTLEGVGGANLASETDVLIVAFQKMIEALDVEL